MTRLAITTTLILCATTGSAVAQGGGSAALYTFDGVRPGERLGWTICGPGDLDGDGAPDILAGGPGDFISGGFPGIVRAYSGRNGSVLYTVTGQQNADGFGLALASLPDIDGDGTPDFAVGAPYDDAAGVDSGSVYVFSGSTGNMIRKISGIHAGDAFGWSLCDGQDANGDLVPDLVVGAPLADTPLPDSGSVRVFDPLTGALLDAHDGTVALAELGYSVASFNSGVGGAPRCLLASAPGQPVSGGGSPGYLYYWSTYGNNSFAAAPVGSDTVTRLVATRTGPNGSRAALFWTTDGGGTQAGIYEMSFNGTNLSWGLVGYTLSYFTHSLGVGVDGAGGTHLLIGSDTDTDTLAERHLLQPGGGLGFSGQQAIQPKGVTHGWAIAGIGSLNSDPYLDLAIGDPFCNGGGLDSGRVEVLLTLNVPTAVQRYCTAKHNSQGCVPAIGFTGAPTVSVADNFHVTATSVLNNKPGLLLWSLNQNSIPFGGGTLCVGPLFHRTALQNSHGNPPPSDCSGSYDFHFTQAYMSAQALTPGVTVYCQYYSRDDGFPAPQNIGLTDAVRFTVLP